MFKGSLDLLYLFLQLMLLTILIFEINQLIMGQKQSQICPVNMTSQQITQQLKGRFIICPHPIYTTRQDFKLLHQKLTNKQFMLRVLTGNEPEKNMIEERILKRVAFKNDSLTKIQHYIFEKIEAYCSKQFKIYILFELNPSNTLRERILMQGKGEETFTEEKIIEGFQNLVKGIMWIRYFKEKHGNINTHHIYCDNHKMVLADPLLCPQGHQFPEKYPSPEKLKAINNKIEEYSAYQSDIFSLAMCMLEIIPTVKLNGIYKRNYTVNQKNLREQINKCSQYPKLQSLFEGLLLEPYSLQNRKRYLELYSNKCNFLFKELAQSSSTSQQPLALHSFGKQTRAKQLIRLQSSKKSPFLHNQIAQTQEIDAKDKPEIDIKMLLDHEESKSEVEQPQQWNWKGQRTRPSNTLINRKSSTTSSFYQPSVKIFFTYLNPNQRE